MNDLIDRWKTVQLGPNGYCSSPLDELIADTITALSAPLPEFAKFECQCNYQHGIGPNLLCPLHGKRKDLHSKRVRQWQRIEELENKIETHITSYNRLDAALAEILRLNSETQAYSHCFNIAQSIARKARAGE